VRHGRLQRHGQDDETKRGGHTRMVAETLRSSWAID
jgi:hypothetical protein